MPNTKPSARQRDATNAFIAVQQRLEWDMHSRIVREKRLPPEWRDIWEKRGQTQSKVTMRVDDDVLRFFRSMGAGHGPRMNAVLRSFMLARLAGLIREDDLLEEYRERWMGKPRPNLGRTIVEAYAAHGLDADEDSAF